MYARACVRPPVVEIAMSPRSVRGNIRLAVAGLDAALEAIAVPALIVAASGQIAYANRAARNLAAADREHFTRQLLDSLAGRSPAFELRMLSDDEPLHHFLALYRAPTPDRSAKLLRMAVAWGLTRRQTEVLAHLILGGANKAIAAHLGCAESTVELHVTHILAQVGVESRAALVAQFWMAVSE